MKLGQAIDWSPHSPYIVFEFPTPSQNANLREGTLPNRSAMRNAEERNRQQHVLL